MKKLISTLIAIIMLATLLSGCVAETSLAFEPSAYISTSPMPLSAVTLEYTPSAVCSHKNIAFTLCEGKLRRVDILTGEQTIILEDTAALGIGANASSVALVSSESISIYDYDGTQLMTVLHGLELSQIVCVDILDCKVLFASRTGNKDTAYLADLEAQTVTQISDSWKPSKGRLEIAKLSLKENCLQIVCRHNYSIAGYDFSLIECNHSGEKVSFSSVIHSDNGCFDKAGEYYFIDNYGFVMGDTSQLSQVISKLDKETLTDSVIMLIDNPALYEMGIKPKESNTSELNQKGFGMVLHTMYADDYSLEYADGDSFVIYNGDTCALVAFTRDTSIKPLTIIISSYIHEGTLRNWIKEYTAQTGRQVEYRIYPSNSTYSTRMLTKLSAQDTDFDIFVSSSDILNGILTNDAYEPLDNYPQLVENIESNYADGTKELMSDDGRIFGVPYRISMWGNLWLVDDSVSLSSTPTIDEILTLCESLEGSGKALFKSDSMAVRMVQNYVEEMVAESDDIDVDALTELLATLQDYNKRGILCDDENYLFDYGHIYYDYLSLNHVRTEGGRITVTPTQGETRYIDIDSAMLINRASENKEAAAEFLSIVTSEKSVYNNENRLLMGKDADKYSHIDYFGDEIKEVAKTFTSFIDGAKLARLTPVVLSTEFSFTDEIISPMLRGEITAEKAASEIDYRISYFLYE